MEEGKVQGVKMLVRDGLTIVNRANRLVFFHRDEDWEHGLN
jgi:hypothetical protein